MKGKSFQEIWMNRISNFSFQVRGQDSRKLVCFYL